MNRKSLYFAVAMLVVVTIGLGTYVYRLDPRSGVEVTITEDRLSMRDH
jgi:hypothetical protein